MDEKTRQGFDSGSVDRDEPEADDTEASEVRGARVADPQGVVGQFMYRSAAAWNASRGTLEVLVHETSGQIRHVLYRSGASP
jgi:hypothetical protein